jgi:hypothetical protein
MLHSDYNKKVNKFSVSAKKSNWEQELSEFLDTQLKIKPVHDVKTKAVLPLPPTPISSCSSEDESDEDDDDSDLKIRKQIIT